MLEPPRHNMKSRFVVDGSWRRRRSAEIQARLSALRETVRARYAAELADAGFFNRLLLRWRLAAEFRRERKKIEPSAQSLYSSRITARII